MQHILITMWEKISLLPVTARVVAEDYTKRFIEDFKNDESGLEVVQVVLIILVGVLLIGALWAVLGGWLGDLWEQIIDDTGGWDRPDWYTGG